MDIKHLKIEAVQSVCDALVEMKRPKEHQVSTLEYVASELGLKSSTIKSQSRNQDITKFRGSYFKFQLGDLLIWEE